MSCAPSPTTWGQEMGSEDQSVVFFVGGCSGRIDEDNVDLSELSHRNLCILETLLSRAQANVRHEKYINRRGTSW